MAVGFFGGVFTKSQVPVESVKKMMLLSTLQESLQVFGELGRSVLISELLLNFSFTALFSTAKRRYLFIYAIFSSIY